MLLFSASYPSVSRRFLVVGAAFFAGSVLPVSAVTYVAGGVYDSPTNGNAVDANATGNPLTSIAANDVLGFTANVATAFAAEWAG